MKKMIYDEAVCNVSSCYKIAK